jgi:hypothetical protein
LQQRKFLVWLQNLLVIYFLLVFFFFFWYIFISLSIA